MKLTGDILRAGIFLGGFYTLLNSTEAATKASCLWRDPTSPREDSGDGLALANP